MSDEDIKEDVKQRVCEIANKVDWPHLTVQQRQKYYETWTTDPQIGVLLSQVMEPTRIRVYLKDTVMKTYLQEHRPTLRTLLASMAIPYSRITKEYVKPQALLCDGTILYTLTVAREWKIAVVSAFERGCEMRDVHKNVVFITEHTTGRFVDKGYRNLIDSAAKRLDVEVQWLT